MSKANRPPAYVSAFRALFDGRRDAYGAGDVCIREDVTDRVIGDHLEGRRRIGIYPVAGPDRNRVRFGCVDLQVDDWPLAHALAEQLRGTYGITAHLERSRGGGWHVWTFFASWVLAWKVRALLHRAIADLGDRVRHPVEVFPRDDRLAEGAYGSYVNLPLFGGDVEAGRTCFHEPGPDGRPVIVRSFDPARVEAAGNRDDALTDLTEVLGAEPREPGAYERGAPVAPGPRRVAALLPCALRMLKDGARRGQAAQWVPPLAVHLQRTGHDLRGASLLLHEWNEVRNVPPLDVPKLVELVAAGFKAAPAADASLGCDDEAVLPLCVKAECPVWRAKQAAAADLPPDPTVPTLAKFDLAHLTFEFRRGALTYLVSELDNRRGARRAVVDVLLDGRGIFRGTVNLDSDQSRRTTEKRCAESAKVAGVARDLMAVSRGIAVELENVGRATRETAERAKQGYVMSEQEVAAAEGFGHDHPRILYDAIAFTSQHGLVREKTNRCLLLLVFTSRKMSNPISGIGKGDSASGKSHLAATILKFIPPEDICEFTRITGSALYYGGEFDLAHKVFFVREAPGGDDSEMSLRTFMSDGDAKIWTVEKDDEGRNRTVEKTVRGPICFYTTTTQLEVNPENETRLLQVHSDETADMTHAVTAPIAWAAEHGSLDATDEQLAPWRAFQRILKLKERVVVPFASQLRAGFPTNLLRARRDFARMLQLIKASAYLHQFHRKREESCDADGNPERWIVASVADYAIVKQLIQGSIMRSAKNVKAGQEELMKAVGRITTAAREMREEGKEFDARAEVVADPERGGQVVWIHTPFLREWLGKTQRAVLALVKSLEDEGLLATMPNRRPVRVRLGNGVDASGEAFLPTVDPELLFQQYPADRAHLYDPLAAPDFDDLYPPKQ